MTFPGASLDGKNPSELSVVQLKQWLVCHGAPVTGKKPELIQRHAGSFISYYFGFTWWYQLSGFVTILSMSGTSFWLDPDDGVNVKCKLQITAKHQGSFKSALLQSIPPVETRKNCIAEKVSEHNGSKSSDAFESISYTCALDKVYRSFQDGYVQNVRFHSIPTHPNYWGKCSAILEKGKL